MDSLRAFIRDHRWLAIWLVTLALGMKIMMPSGFMVGGARSLAIAICDGRGANLAKQVSVPLAGRAPDAPADPGKAADACPYAALGMAALADPQPALLIVALAFMLTRRGGLAVVPQLAREPFLRPPLRAPPLRG